VSQQTGIPTVISSSPSRKTGKCYPAEKREDSIKCGFIANSTRQCYDTTAKGTTVLDFL
jgi:hypothetical protein